MRFTLKQLSYFVAAGEAGSVQRAADSCHVSQASISNAIAHLEDVFATQLFIRHHAQGVSLTTAGKELIREAKQLLNSADELNGFADRLANQVFGTLNVGCFSPLAPIIIPDLCHGFMSAHSGAQVVVAEGHQAELLRLLQHGDIDLALTYDLHLHKDIDFVPLASLKPYVLLSKKHPLAGKKKLKLTTLAQEPFILLDLPLSNSYFMSLFGLSDIKPNVYARTTQTSVQRGLVAKGYGYSLANVRPINQRSLDGSELSYIPLAGEEPALTLGIAMLNSVRRTIALGTFIHYCKAQISNEKIPGMINF